MDSNYRDSDGSEEAKAMEIDNDEGPASFSDADGP